MGCIDRIKERYDLFTKSEKKVADYILENPIEAYDFSVQQLAQYSESSPSSIIRFIKKTGYDGYTQFRLELAKESLRTEDDQHNDFLLIEGINKEDSTQSLMSKFRRYCLNTIDKTFDNLNHSTLSAAISILQKASKICIVGEGTSFSVAEDLCRKLLLVGVNANCFGDAPTQLSMVNNMTEDDALILISYSGDSKLTHFALKRGKKLNVPSISITHNLRSFLATASDLLLTVPSLEHERDIGSISSRTAMMTICDLLYLGMVKSDIDQTKQRIDEYRIMLKQLKNNK